MNEDEKIVFSFYKRENLKIIPKPNGEYFPPDFLLSDFIAVEVRRLNQLYYDNESYSGAENQQITISSIVQEVCQSFKHNSFSESYNVFFRFQRGETNYKYLKSQLYKTLREYLKNPQENLITICDSLSVTIIKSANKNDQAIFNIAGITDIDDCYIPLANYQKIIKTCIDEKDKKIEKFLYQFPSWKLALVDHIGDFHAKNKYIKRFKSSFNYRGKYFDEIVVFDFITKKIILSW